MADTTIVDVDLKGAPAGGRCFLRVARDPPQVAASTGTYHRECFEAWYFGRHGTRPRLVAGRNGDRHRLAVREREVDRAA